MAPVAPAEQPAREVTTTKRKPPRGASRAANAPAEGSRLLPFLATSRTMRVARRWTTSGRGAACRTCTGARRTTISCDGTRDFARSPWSALALGSEASYRYVRQGTELWDDLHRGRLTTGCLTGALGFQEEGVHRALGMGGRSGSHGPLVGAYHRLRQPLLRFDLGARTLEQEEAANGAAVRAFNENLPSPGERVDDSDSEPDADAEPVSASAEATKKPRRNAKGKTKKKGRCATCQGENGGGVVRARALDREPRRAFAPRRAERRGWRSHVLGERAGSRHGGDPRVATSRRRR